MDQQLCLPRFLHLNKGLKRKFNKGHAFTSKCISLVKEQRARLYILRRCATMLCCWYIHGDE
ncbi:unnamed protein product [Arabidopsis halleri]